MIWPGNIGIGGFTRVFLIYQIWQVQLYTYISVWARYILTGAFPSVEGILSARSADFLRLG